MSSDEKDEAFYTPPEINKAAEIGASNLLPNKSRVSYMNTYATFMNWRKSRKINSFSENVLLIYFDEMSKQVKPSTLWSRYSMLKSTISTNQNIDIATYKRLIAFIKKQSEGFKSKKSKVLSSEQIEKFLTEAPDNQYLATKVALIFGIAGACRREELTNITINDIENHGAMLLVKILNTKTKIPRLFTVDGEFCNIVKKYEALRPKDVKSNRFFLNLQNGKCTVQPIGINKFGNMPKQIAEYLKLPNASSYTGHSFRRSSAKLLADSRTDITTIKRHGGWKSMTVAKGYIEDSINNKRKTGNQITKLIILPQSTFNQNSEIKTPAPKRPKNDENDDVNAGNLSSIFQISSGTNVTFHLTNCTVNILK